MPKFLSPITPNASTTNTGPIKIGSGINVGADGTISLSQNQKTWYGACTTAAGTATKAVVCNNFSLEDGVRISVHFNYSNTLATVYLNVNSTGAKRIVSAAYTDTNGKAMVTEIADKWQQGETLDFVYDSSYEYWIMLRGKSATTTYYGVTKLTDAVDSTSITTAATPNSVKQAYDLANTANTTALGKQDALVSGTNIKTINGNSILGSGNIEISGGSSTNQKTWYGVSTTAASTSTKVVTCEGFILEDGARISVLFSNANTYSSLAYLNVNNTGAVLISQTTNSGIAQYMWQKGEVVDFVYSSTNEKWFFVHRATATTTYYGPTKLSSSTSSTSTSLAATPSAVKAAYDLANSQKTTITTGSITSTNIYSDGKQVYVKRIAVSAFPDSSTSAHIYISTGISENISLFEIKGVAKYGNPVQTTYPVPYSNRLLVDYKNSDKQIDLYSPTNYGSYYGYIDFYFTYD